MPESEMLKKILSDYLDANPQDSAAVGVLNLFCAYASKWLNDSGLVGVGHTTTGISLRFANGQEYLLTKSAGVENPVSDMPGMSITGNNGGSVRAASGMADNSIRITG